MHVADYFFTSANRGKYYDLYSELKFWCLVDCSKSLIFFVLFISVTNSVFLVTHLIRYVRKADNENPVPTHVFHRSRTLNIILPYSIL